jgi:hypothetical protein
MEAVKPTPVVYQPLTSRTSFRILKLHPASQGADISCHLTYESLAEDELPKYVALSYVWGDPNVTTAITVNDQPFQVTLNLASALRHLRNAAPTDEIPTGFRTLWVDAICINQRDLAERNQQVQVMGDIYSEAAQVIVWLGERNQTSDLAFDLLEKLGASTKQDFLDYAALVPNPTSFTPVAGYQGPPIVAPREINDNDIEALKATFLKRDWWTRLWVVQEVTVARSVFLLCGDRPLWWHTLNKVLRGGTFHWARSDMSLYARLSRPLSEYINMSMQCRSAYGSRITRHLDQWLVFYHDRGCSDPRDLIYALLGISKFPRPDLRPVPDYTKAVDVVFREATVAMIAGGDLTPILGPRIDDWDFEGIMPGLIPNLGGYPVSRRILSSPASYE